MAQQNEKDSKKLYNALLRDGYTDLGTEQEFTDRVQQRSNSDILYDALLRDGYTDLGTKDEFFNRLNEATPSGEVPGTGAAAVEKTEYPPSFTESELNEMEKEAAPATPATPATPSATPSATPPAYGTPEYLSEQIADDVNPQNPYIGMTRQQALNTIGSKFFNEWYGKPSSYKNIKNELASNNIASPSDIGRITASIRNSYVAPVARRRVEELMKGFDTANQQNIDDIRDVLNSRETQQAIESDLSKLGMRNTADMYDNEEDKQKAEAEYKRQRDAYYGALSQQMERLLQEKYGYLPTTDGRSTLRAFNSALMSSNAQEHEERITRREYEQRIGDYYNSAIQDAFKKADERGTETENKVLDTPTMASQGASMAKSLVARKKGNEERDPDKILHNLLESANAPALLLTQDPEMFEKFWNDAVAKGMDINEYISLYVVPAIQSGITKRFEEEAVRRELPKNDVEYILRGLEDSLPGMLISSFVNTESQQRYRNMANAQYGEDAGLLANAGRMTVGFVGDAPLWAGWGKLGGAVAKRQMAEYMVKEASRRGVSLQVMQRAMQESANHYLGKAIGQRMMQGVPQMAITMGGAMATSEFARGIRDREELGTIIGNTLGTAVTEGIKGGVIGAFTGAAHPWVDRLSGIGKVAGKAGSFAGEAGVFYTAGELEKLAKGEDAFGNPLEGLAESALNLAFIKMTNVDNIKRYAQAIAHPKKALEAKQGELTNEDIEIIRANADGAEFIDAITSMRPARKLPGSAEPEREPTEAEINAGAEAYRRMMTNPDIPFATKQRVARIVDGILPPPGKAVTAEVVARDGEKDYVLRTRAIDGQLLEEKRYDSKEEADEAANGMRDELFLNTTEALEGAINKTDSYIRFRDSLERQYQEIAQKMGDEGESMPIDRLSDHERRVVYLHQHYDDLLDIYQQIADGKDFDVKGSELAQQFLQAFNEYVTSGKASTEFKLDFQYERGLEGDAIDKAMKRRSKEDRVLLEDYQQAMLDHISEGNKKVGVEDSVADSPETEEPVRGADDSGEAGRMKAGGNEPPSPPAAGGGAGGQDGANGLNEANGSTDGAERTARRETAYQRGAAALEDKATLPGINLDLKLAIARMERLFPANDAVLSRLRSDIQEAVQNGDDAEVERLITSYSGILNNSQREAIEQYRDMVETQSGLDDAMVQQVKSYEQERRAALEPYKASDGSITEIELSDGSKAYYLAGDLNNKLGGVMVITENGERKQIPVNLVKSVGERQMLDDIIKGEVDAYSQQIEQQYEALANGGDFIPGSKADIMVAGRPFTVTVVGKDAPGNIIFAMEDGSQMYMSASEARRAIADADRAKIDAQLKLEAEAAVKQQQTERFTKGIVGYAEGRPDIMAEDSDQKAVAEYLESQADGSNGSNGHEKLLRDMQTEAERLRREAYEASETVKRLSNKEAVEGLTSRETAEMKTAEVTMNVAQRRRRKVGEIRQALMTDEERQKFEAERQKQIQKVQEAVSKQQPAADATGAVAVPTGKELLEQYAEQGDAERYVDGIRQNLKTQYRDELMPQLSAIRDALNDYRRGLTDITYDELRDMVTKVSQLEAQDAAMVKQSKELAQLASSLGRLYAARNKAAMTPHEQKVAAMEKESDPSKKIKLAREAFRDDEEALSFLDDNSMQPQDEYEWVTSHLGKGSINWEGLQRGEHKVRGLISWFGPDKKRGIGKGYDTNGINYFLAPEGKGKGIDEIVHTIAEGSPYDDTVIANALEDMLRNASKPTDITNRIVDERITRAEEIYNENLEREREAEEEARREAEQAANQQFPVTEPTVSRNETDSLVPGNSEQGNGKVEGAGDGAFHARLARAKEEVNTAPTEGQKEAGNYKKGHVSFGGYDYTIENPKGTVRSGVDKNGKKWSTTMKDTYGYIRGKFDKDGDHIDMFINDDADLDKWNGRVFVVDQARPDADATGTMAFDEHKVMYGYNSWNEAKKAYERNYEPGWWDSHVLQMTGVRKEDFDKWLEDSDHKRKPFAEYVRTKAADPVTDNVDQLIADVRERVRQLPTWEPDEIAGMDDERLTQLLKKRQKDLSTSRYLLKSADVEGTDSAKEKLLQNNIAKAEADIKALEAEVERRGQMPFTEGYGNLDFMIEDVASEPAGEPTVAVANEKNGGNVFPLGKNVVSLHSQEAREVVDGQRETMPQTAPWREGVEEVTVHTTLSNVRKKYGELFEKAKAGDVEAAEELVNAVVKPEKVKALAEQHPNAKVAFVHAEEATGRNALPLAYAFEFDKAGLKLSPVFQTNKPAHTGSDRVGRFIRRARFGGEVEPGAEYILVDDHVTMGGTLRDLKDYIESKGGKVVAVSTLTASAGGTKLRPTEDQIKQLNEKGITDEQLRELGISDSTDGLTRREAAEILVLADKGGNTGTSRGRQTGSGVDEGVSQITSQGQKTKSEASLGGDGEALRRQADTEKDGLTDIASEAAIVSLPRVNKYGLNENTPLGRKLTRLKEKAGAHGLVGYTDPETGDAVFMGNDADTVFESGNLNTIETGTQDGMTTARVRARDIDTVSPRLVRDGYKLAITDSKVEDDTPPKQSAPNDAVDQLLDEVGRRQEKADKREAKSIVDKYLSEKPKTADDEVRQRATKAVLQAMENAGVPYKVVGEKEERQMLRLFSQLNQEAVKAFARRPSTRANQPHGQGRYIVYNMEDPFGVPMYAEKLSVAKWIKDGVQKFGGQWEILDIGEPAADATGTVAGRKAAELYPNLQADIETWHGSGSLFTKFDHSHMGEGAGSQVFGWGTYLSDGRKVAEGYAQTGGEQYFYKGKPVGSDPWSDEPAERALFYIEQERGVRNAIKFLKELIKEEEDESVVKDYEETIKVLQDRNGFTKGQPVLYRVEIPDDTGENYLDWMTTIKKPLRRKIADAVRQLDGEPQQSVLYTNYKNGWQSLADMIEREPWAYKEIHDRILMAFGGRVKDAEKVSKLMSEAGFIGVKYPAGTLMGGGDGATNYVIFNEGDAKIVDTIQFMFSEPDAEAPVFVSNALRAVESIKQEKATPEQWLAMIQKAGGLKAGEDKWIGLSEWLKEQQTAGKKSLTKQEVEDFIRENQIEIEEVNYSESTDIDNNPKMKELRDEFNEIKLGLEGEQSDLETELDEFINKMYEKYGYGWNDKLSDEEIEYAERFNALNSTEGTADEKAFREMVSRYGDDFEMAFEVDGNGRLEPVYDSYEGSITDAARYFLDINDKPINSTRLDYTTHGLHNKREIALVVPTIEPWNESDNVHFGDAGNGRGVMWMRFGDTYAPNMGGDPNSLSDGVSKVLVIDEIQSKRHQEGREKGYKPEVTAAQQQAYEKAQEAHRKAVKAFSEYKETLDEKYGDVRQYTHSEDLFAPGDKASERWMANFTNEERAEYDRLKKDMQEKSNAVIEMEHEIGTNKFDQRVPGAPFEKNWHEVAMKRMLRYAAENGYDKIAWTKGDQQAERYNIGTVVRAIDAGIDQEGNRVMLIHLNQGGTADITYDENGNITHINNIGKDAGLGEAKNISEIVGKEIAAGALSVQGKGTENMKSWKGDGLRIGAEGMKGFYDDMLVRFMNKYGKKWGVKVGEVNLPDIGLTMWSVDVTPEMKESVMQGQPLFQKEGKRILGWSDGKQVYLTAAGLNPNTPIHECTHLWDKWLQKERPELWKKLVSAMKKTAMWEEIRKNPNYRNIWNDDDRMASEVHSRLSGANSEEEFMQAAFKKDTPKKIIDEVKSVLRKFWEALLRLFGKQTKTIGDDWNSLDAIVRMPLRDLLNKDFEKVMQAATDPEAYASGAVVEGHIVEDKDEIARLNKEPKEKGYRNVVLNDDGTLGSPMANRLGKKGEGRKATAPFEYGKWERSDEHPELANENGKIDLIKPDGKPVEGVDYNPYIHIRPDKVNRQFKQAWERPNLIYVETEYPKSELDGDYQAEKAAKPVGKHKWGTQGESLILSRWDKPVRMVPWEEVADDWVKAFKDRGVEFDIVPPKLLPILVERGVEILPPHKGMGKACNEAYEKFKAGQTNEADKTKAIFDQSKKLFGTTYDIREAGYVLPDGSMLDFSGRHSMNPGSDTSFLRGRRSTDHREIQSIAYERDGNTKTGVETDMPDFIRRGAIRIDNNAGTINLFVKPTKQQATTLRKLIANNDGYVQVDFGDGWDSQHYVEYDAAKPANVMADIDRYFDEGIKPEGNSGKMYRHATPEVEKANNRFNEELERQINDPNFPKNHVYKLGKPSSVLLSTGFPNDDIELSASHLKEKSEAAHHPFKLEDVRDLVKAINDPIAVFSYGDKGKSQNVIAEIQKDGKNFVVGIHFNQNRRGMVVSDIRGLYPKDNAEWLNWITQGKLLYADKEKIQNLIAQQRRTLAEVGYLDLNFVAKVIKDFESPKLSEEKLQELFPEYSSLAEDMGDMLGGQKVTLEAEGPEKGTLGWYDPNDNSVHVVLPAHSSAAEVRRTVCHEKLGHEGLVALMGSQGEVNKFGTFIFKSASKPLRQRILEKADEEGYNWNDPLRLSKAAQEVFGDIAADGPKTADEFSLWDKAKHYLIKLAKKLGIKVRGLLNDHDLAYYVLKTGEALKRWGKMDEKQRQNVSAQASEYDIMRSRRGKPRKKNDESMSQYLQRLREWEKWNIARETAEANGDPMPDKEAIDKRYDEQYKADMAAWREENGLSPADAEGAETGPGEFPKREEGETPQEYAIRVAEHESQADMWKGAPDYFDYIQRAQEEYRRDYEEWKRRYDLQEEDNVDMAIYEGRGGEGPQTYTDEEAEWRAERDVGEAFGVQMDSEGAKRHAKLAVIDRRKNLESSNADDALWLHDFVKKTEELAQRITAENGGQKVTGKMLREALPFIIEGTYWEETLRDEDGQVVGFADISDQMPIKKSPEIDALLADIKEWYDHFFFALEDAGLRGDAGYIGNGYVNHIWDKGKSDPKAWEKYVENYQRTKSPNMKHREMETYQQGIDVGLVPKFKDIADIMAYYSRSNNEALANKKFLDDLSFMCVEETNSDGEVTSVLPLLNSEKPDAMVADRYVRYHVPGVGDVWVIKDIQKRFSNIFGTMRTQDVNKWLETSGKVWDITGSTAKKIELALSGFHALALWEVDVAQNGPVAGLYDLFKYIVTDSAMKGTLPAYAHPDDFKFAASHLVQLGATEDYAAADVNNITGKLREMVMELYGSDNNFKKAAGVAGSVPAIMLDWVNKGFDKVLWNYLHDGLKIASMMRFKHQIDRRAEKEGLSDEEREKLYDEAGQYVNDMFGGQYWELLNVSPGTLKWMRRLLLSPDWLVSTNRHFFANFGFGSIYSDGGWQEYLKYNWNNIKRSIGSKVERDELRRFRSKNAKLCYLVGVMFFWNVLYNALNAWNRKHDEEKWKEYAEEMRKTNPDYKSPYELAYPDGMKWYDYTMLGNALGQQTHLFTGRYDDGTETYVRWGKQFREFPEMFIGRHGLEFPAPLIERMKAKANPNIGGIMDFLGALGVRGFEEGYQNRELREKYGRTISTLSSMFRHFIPFGIPTQSDKEYKVLDFFMPSSKGFSRYKAVDYFKTFIIDGDMRGVEQTYQAAVMNDVDAEACLNAAIASLKAEQRKELREGVTDLTGASERFDAATTYQERAYWKRKMDQYLGAENHHAMQRQEFMENVQRMLDGLEGNVEDPNKTWSVATESYLMRATRDDIIEDYRVRVVSKAVSDMKTELSNMQAAGLDESIIEDYRRRPEVKRLFKADKLLGTYKRSKKKHAPGYDAIRGKMVGGENDDALMQQIREKRHELLEQIDALE